MKFLLCIAGGLLAATSYAQISVVKLDVNPLGRSRAMSYTSFNGKTYFIGKSDPVGTELWWSDGVNFGMVADIYPGPVNSIYPDPLYGANLCVVGNELYFPATDGPHGTQIWVYDGVNPPKMAINQGAGGMERSHLTELNGELYYKATIPSAVGNTRVYRYTPATQVWTDISPTMDVKLTEPMAVVNGKLVTPGSFNGGPVELQVYDPGTGVVTTLDVNGEPAPSNPIAFYTHDNVLYFQATSTAYGSELYSYNGSSAPTRLTDIMPGADSSFGGVNTSTGARKTFFNNKLYFMAVNNKAPQRWQLYSYNPVGSKVQMEKSLESNNSSRGMVVYNDRLYISVDVNNKQKYGLFIYDGNNITQPAELSFSSPNYAWFPTVSNNRLFFTGFETYNSSNPLGEGEVYVVTDTSKTNDVDDVSNANGIMVYPNPASTVLGISVTLTQKQTLKVNLTDIQGRVVYATETQQYNTGQHEIKIPVQQLATGSYIYSVVNSEGEIMWRGKLMKD